MAVSKYGRWHDAIIARAKLRKIEDGYKERHHIKPRSLGGTDHPANLVDLTYREHFLIHWILTKTTEPQHRGKMICALRMMAMPNVGERIVSSWQYDVVKRANRIEASRREKQEQAVRDAKAISVWNRAINRVSGDLRMVRIEDRAILRESATDWLSTKYPRSKAWPDQVRERQEKAKALRKYVYGSA